MRCKLWPYGYKFAVLTWHVTGWGKIPEQCFFVFTVTLSLGWTTSGLYPHDSSGASIVVILVNWSKVGKDLIWKTATTTSTAAATATAILHIPQNGACSYVFQLPSYYPGLFAVQNSNEFCRWQKRWPKRYKQHARHDWKAPRDSQQLCGGLMCVAFVGV